MKTILSLKENTTIERKKRFSSKKNTYNPIIKKPECIFINDNISLWLTNHDFDIEKNKASDLLKFLTNCPLGRLIKKLSIHNIRVGTNSLGLILKEPDSALCFTLKASNGEFILKTSKEPSWIFNKEGKLIKRLEHKKVKIWLEEHEFHINSKQKSDLEIFLSSCPICKIEKPLRFQRATKNRLDLQCGCISYFSILAKDNSFIFTSRSKIIKIFNKEGKETKI